MKYVIHKPYWNYEKEEKWLNDMCLKGLALTDYSWCRYVFEDCCKGEYIYRIELLEHRPSHPESMAYIRFLEETGIEHIASYMNWVYFRKKAEDGPFDLYSDINSKLKHYKRVNRLWNALAIIELLIGGINLAFGLLYYKEYTELTLNLTEGLILIILGFAFLYLASPIKKKIKALNNEKNIRE